MTTSQVRRPRARPRLGRPLDLSSVAGFPLRQQLRIASDPESRAEAVGRAVLEEAGFVHLERSGVEEASTGSSPSPSLTWVGERGVRRQGVTSSTAVVPMIVVFAAGAILGGLDAYILGSPEVGIFWVLGAAATSGLFWLIYGGTYDSDLILLSVSRPAPTATASATSVVIVLWAARIRSQIRADRRFPSVVSGPLKLAAEVGQLVRELDRRMARPTPGPRRAGPGPN